jgi:hypothetical protein
LLVAAVLVAGSIVGSVGVSAASTATRSGHGGQGWAVAADGAVTPHGGAPHYGDTTSVWTPDGRLLRDALWAPVVGMASSLSGDGYWLVAADSGVFAFGDAPFHGTLYQTLQALGIPATADNVGSIIHGPVKGIARDPNSDGYWLWAADGGVFTFGARFHGSPYRDIHLLGRTAVAFRVTGEGSGYEITDSAGVVHRCQGGGCIPLGSGWPDADTTGPRPGLALQPSGSIVVSTDGAVVQNLHVTGQITVRANNVTIRDVMITATSKYGIQVEPETVGTVIEDVAIVGGLAAGHCEIGIVYGSFTARRVEITRCSDGIHAGSNTVFERSWIHHMRDLPTDHSDGIQSIGGQNIALRGNSIEMDLAMTSAMLLHAHIGGDLRDVLVEGNRLAGGGYTLNIKHRTNRAANIVVRGNVWIRDSYNFGSHTGDAANDPAVTSWSANWFDDRVPYGFDAR